MRQKKSAVDFTIGSVSVSCTEGELTAYVRRSVSVENIEKEKWLGGIQRAMVLMTAQIQGFIRHDEKGKRQAICFSGHHLGVAAVLCFLGKEDHLRYFLKYRTLMTCTEQAEAAFFGAACGGQVDMLKALSEDIAAEFFDEVVASDGFKDIVNVAADGEHWQVLATLMQWAQLTRTEAQALKLLTPKNVPEYQTSQTTRMVHDIVHEAVSAILDSAVSESMVTDFKPLQVCYSGSLFGQPAEVLDLSGPDVVERSSRYSKM